MLTAAFGTFSGSIYNVYAPGDAPQNYAYPVPTTSPNGYGGVIIAGGVETFSGDNFYSGDTGIGGSGGLILTGTLENSGVANAGYFQNDGVVRMMTVSTGAVAGNGAFAGGLDVASGLISPGDPGQTGGGHMTIGTGLSLGADATYLVRAAGAAVSRIDVNGAATIGGSTLDTMFAAVPLGAVLGQRNTVLTASNGVVGQFGAFNFNLGYAASPFPFLDANLGYAPDAVSFDIVRSGIPFVAAARTRNEYGVASGLDTMNPWLPASLAAASLNFATAPAAYDTLAGRSAFFASHEPDRERLRSWRGRALPSGRSGLCMERPRPACELWRRTAGRE